MNKRHVGNHRNLNLAEDRCNVVVPFSDPRRTVAPGVSRKGNLTRNVLDLVFTVLEANGTQHLASGHIKERAGDGALNAPLRIFRVAGLTTKQERSLFRSQLAIIKPRVEPPGIHTLDAPDGGGLPLAGAILEPARLDRILINLVGDVVTIRARVLT